MTKSRVLNNRRAKIGVKLEQYEGASEAEVLKGINRVNNARRAACNHLIETGFDERAAKKKRALLQDSSRPVANTRVAGSAAADAVIPHSSKKRRGKDVV